MDLDKSGKKKEENKREVDFKLSICFRKDIIRFLNKKKTQLYLT
jgi:hypothetical protein